MNILVFELSLIVLTIAVYLFMKKLGYKNVERKLIILLISVILFETMTEPMWSNTGLDSWAYLFKDVSWIISLGWVCIVMISMMIVDYFLRKTSEVKKFFAYLVLIVGATTIIESILVTSGIRSYAPELLARTTGINIPILNLPIEALLVLAIIGTLVISTYKYINYIFNKR
jgi:hypothetical protein